MVVSETHQGCICEPHMMDQADALSSHFNLTCNCSVTENFVMQTKLTELHTSKHVVNKKGLRVKTLGVSPIQKIITNYFEYIQCIYLLKLDNNINDDDMNFSI